jgi:hypothetical protein
MVAIYGSREARKGAELAPGRVIDVKQLSGVLLRSSRVVAGQHRLAGLKRTLLAFELARIKNLIPGLFLLCSDLGKVVLPALVALRGRVNSYAPTKCELSSRSAVIHEVFYAEVVLGFDAKAAPACQLCSVKQLVMKHCVARLFCALH